MKSEKNIKRAAYVAIIALLAVVFWCYWVWHRIEQGETQVFYPDVAVSVLLVVCALLFYAAIGYAVYIIIRKCYLALTTRKTRWKHDHDA
jgi:hypothetical protein